MHAIILMENSAGINVCYYFDRKLCWHNYRTMLNTIIMTVECLVSYIYDSIIYIHACEFIKSANPQRYIYIYIYIQAYSTELCVYIINKLFCFTIVLIYYTLHFIGWINGTIRIPPVGGVQNTPTVSLCVVCSDYEGISMAAHLRRGTIHRSPV